MIVYKLTDQDNKTRGGLEWKVGDWHMEPGQYDETCNDGLLHAYGSSLLAIFMNPIHANIDDPKLWKAECQGKVVQDSGLKIGCTALRITEELLIPQIDQEHRQRFALMASLQLCSNPNYRAWASDTLAGEPAKMIPRSGGHEPGEEVAIRTYAYAAGTYENVERNSALAVQCAAQYKPIDVQALAIEAFGQLYPDYPAPPNTRYGTAMRQRSK